MPQIHSDVTPMSPAYSTPPVSGVRGLGVIWLCFGVPAGTVHVREIGAENVKRKAAEGDREAQYSQGLRLVRDADGSEGASLGAGGRSSKADAGLVALCTAQFPDATSHQTEMRCG